MNITRKLTTFIITFFVVLNVSSFVYISQNTVAQYSTPINGGGMNPNASVYYSHWNETIIIGMDGSLLIIEEMTFWLAAGSYSYAYRNLKWNNFHNLNSWSVKSATGTPTVAYINLVKEGVYINFYWEWYSTYVTSGTEFTFILTYNVSSAMILNGNRDRLYWNVIGGEFDYSIYDISTRVIFPTEHDVDDVRSTTYYQGKNPGDDEGTIYNADGHTQVVFHQNSVAPLESYTIDTDSPPAGIVMPFSWRVYLNNNWILVFTIGFLPYFLFFLVSFLVKGLDPKARIIPELNEVTIKKCTTCGYKDLRQVKFCPQCGSTFKTFSETGPPSSLTPAEVGVLLDEKFDKIDFIAEFFYLAEQGYLKIVQIETGGEIYFQQTEKTSFYGGLSEFDKDLLKFIGQYSYDTLWMTEKDDDPKTPDKQIAVRVTSLSTIKSHITSLWTKKNIVYAKLTGGETKYFTSNPEKIKNSYFGLTIFLGVIGAFLAFWAFDFFHLAGVIPIMVGIIISSLSGLIFARKMPKLTKFGVKEKASWLNYLQILRGQLLGFPDPYEQFNYSMDHFAYLLVDPKFNLPVYLKNLSKQIKETPPIRTYDYIAPYWYYYPGIMFYSQGGASRRLISGFDSMGHGFESFVSGISNMAESLPEAISNLSEGISSAISNMSESFTPPSSSGGSSGFGGGFSGGGGGGGGGGIG
ncbi:MAG: DUF2207 domain-containing protein [Candidatus Heimdallarchaeota archaeon]|nr:DUF2207 domain-containing protein [Candidatus Heimdallarchaeota archaeon]